MNTGVYKILFGKSLLGLDEDYEFLSEIEQEKISLIDTESFFDFEDQGGNYICYLLCSELEVRKYSDILTNNFIGHTINDLSVDILSFKVVLEDQLNYVLDTSNSIKYTFFMDDLNRWIIKRLDMDFVLDRINLLGGINKLSENEKEFLKNFRLP